MSALSAFLALGLIAEGTFTFTEISGAGGYVRRPVDLVPAGGGKMVNGADIQFPLITSGSWPLFNAYAIFDAATAGNQLMAWRVALPEHNYLLRNKRWKIPRGDIQLTFPVVTSSHGSEVIMSGPYALSPQGLFLTPSIQSMSQEDYDALATKDGDTLYFTTEE